MDLSEASESGNVQGDSVTSTPRKRKRRGNRSKNNIEEVVDFLPIGSSFSQGNLLGDNLQGGGKIKLESEEAIPLLAQDAQPAAGVDPMFSMQRNMRTHLSPNDASLPTDNLQHTRLIHENAPKVPSKREKIIRGHIPKHPEMRIG